MFDNDEPSDGAARAASVLSCYSSAGMLFDGLVKTCRHHHPRFLNVKLRVTKTGTMLTDMFVVRIYSYFAYVSEVEEAALGPQTIIQCNSEETNLPQLLKGVLSMAAAALVVDNNGATLIDMPVFPHMATGATSNVVRFLRPTTCIIKRLTRDLRRIGMDLNNCERAVRMYAFRRGGSQELLDWSGKYELMMRLGDWKVQSISFFTYITSMNAHGTLRSTLRSFGQDDVTHTVTEIMATNNNWAVGVLASLRARMMGHEPPLDSAGVTEFDQQAVSKLCSVFIECVLQLQHGEKDADEDDRQEKVEVNKLTWHRISCLQVAQVGRALNAEETSGDSPGIACVPGPGHP